MLSNRPEPVVQWGEPLPFSPLQIAAEWGTPSWIYRRSVIEERIAEASVFDVVRYAQKAAPNIALLQIVKQAGGVVDAVSAGEVARALHLGFDPHAEVPGVVYTADLFDEAVLELIATHKVPVNIGSADMIDRLIERKIDVPLTLRINPGFGHGHSRKTNTGGELSKHGIWHQQIHALVAKSRQHGLQLQGLHFHIGSGTDFEHLSQVCDAMVAAAAQFGPGLKTISAGGGLPISYHKGENATPKIDLAAYYKLWDKARKEIEGQQGHKVTLEVEPGRFIVGESGYLLSQIRTIKQQGSQLFYLLDAGFNELVRPAFYGSYHEITVVAADGRPLTEWVDAIVGGPLCESGDVFTQEEGGYVVSRRLPKAEVGDFVLFHDAGAYGSSMSSNYNSRPLAAELLESGGKVEQIRRRQELSDTFRWEELPPSLR